MNKWETTMRDTDGQRGAAENPDDDFHGDVIPTVICFFLSGIVILAALAWYLATKGM